MRLKHWSTSARLGHALHYFFCPTLVSSLDLHRQGNIFTCNYSTKTGLALMRTIIIISLCRIFKQAPEMVKLFHHIFTTRNPTYLSTFNSVIVKATFLQIWQGWRIHSRLTATWDQPCHFRFVLSQVTAACLVSSHLHHVGSTPTTMLLPTNISGKTWLV